MPCLLVKASSKPHQVKSEPTCNLPKIGPSPVCVSPVCVGVGERFFLCYLYRWFPIKMCAFQIKEVEIGTKNKEMCVHWGVVSSGAQGSRAAAAARKRSTGRSGLARGRSARSDPIWIKAPPTHSGIPCTQQLIYSLAGTCHCLGLPASWHPPLSAWELPEGVSC